MDVFIVRVEETFGLRLFKNFVVGRVDLIPFRLGQNADLDESIGERSRALDIGLEEPLVEVQRP